MAAGLDFSFVACRLALRALKPVHFNGPAANRLRGALGMILPEPAFRPSENDGPSGFRDRPRPFVLRAAHLDNSGFRAGEVFALDLNVFTDPAPYLEAFGRLKWAALVNVEQSFMRLNLEPADSAVKRVRVHFLTPTELKPWMPSPGALPPFGILAARLRDRLSSLRSFYGPGPLEIDFRAFAATAARIRAVSGSISHHGAFRLSSRTGQTHPLGGFLGYTNYEGELAPFLHWLEAAFFTGIGRHTVWGNGQIRVAAGAA